jgi:cellulose synthase/poly-beta-1,6-N-acetylglucosamine synthase-like glycosyltransferase
VALIYVGTLTVLAVFGLHRLWMILRFRWGAEEQEQAKGDALPGITVQLPIFNERTVAARLLQAVARIDYPVDKLEIQVLDDSTDETREVVEEEHKKLLEAGLDAKILRRTQRVGFKAGALDVGLAKARYDLLCIFDADFVPASDFLRRMLPHFEGEGVGMVQARWGHDNRDESALTRAQATLLDGHFVIEHKVRHDSNLFFNFNGTAGIWRREAIMDAGGWQHDTLTEDLDLSYRAQLAGWRFVYAPYIVAPAELPPTISAFKSQQHRWAKGSMQVIRKLGRRILFSSEPLRVRLEATAHLTAYLGSPCLLLLAAILPLMVNQSVVLPQWLHLVAFVLCTISVVTFYEGSQRAIGRRVGQRLRDTLMAVSLGTGMCINQSRAVLEGMLPSVGTFERTPKRGDAPIENQYKGMVRQAPMLELLFSAWFAWGMYAAVRNGNWGVLPFMALFFVSFAWVGSLGLGDLWRSRNSS